MNRFPLARSSDLLTKDVLDEILVYDLRSKEAHCLNMTAAVIWRACDGTNSVASLREKMTSLAGVTCDENVVWHALKQLHERNLLEVTPEPPPGLLSRRELVAILKTSAILLPLVTSILAPTAVSAATPSGGPQCGPQGPQCGGPQGPQGPQG